jgi:hypothetical protein
MEYFQRRRERRAHQIMEDEEEYAGEYEGQLFILFCKISKLY